MSGHVRHTCALGFNRWALNIPLHIYNLICGPLVRSTGKLLRCPKSFALLLGQRIASVVVASPCPLTAHSALHLNRASRLGNQSQYRSSYRGILSASRPAVPTTLCRSQVSGRRSLCRPMHGPLDRSDACLSPLRVPRTAENTLLDPLSLMCNCAFCLLQIAGSAPMAGSATALLQGQHSTQRPQPPPFRASRSLQPAFSSIAQRQRRVGVRSLAGQKLPGPPEPAGCFFSGSPLSAPSRLPAAPRCGIFRCSIHS